MEGETYCHFCNEEVDIVDKSGWVYRKAREKDYLKKYWLRLVGRELYMKKSPSEEAYRTMQTLIDLEFYLAESLEINDEVYYGIELINGKKTRVYYMTSLDERDGWAEAF